MSGNPGLIQRTAYTDASGSYTMYLPAGTYTLLASAPNYVNASSASQSFGTGTATVNLPLSVMGNLTGTVVDSSGVGVVGAHINFVSSTFSGGATTGTGGRYTTFGMPTGTYTVSASASGYTKVTSNGVGVSTNNSTVANFQLLTSGLLGYWPFNENSGTVAHDQSGNNHDATLSNTTWATGLLGSALAFNGSNSQGVTNSIPFTNTFSISAWVNPAVTSQASFAAIGQSQASSGFYLGVDSTGTQYKFFVNSGNGSTGACAFSSVVSGCAQGGTVTSGWHLIAGTYDGATGSLYVDGALVASDTFAAPSNTSVALEIGRGFTSNSSWNGALDDVRLYNRAVSASEISSLSTTSCTITHDPTASVADVQQMINEALGLRQANDDLNLDGAASVTDVQIIINAGIAVWLSPLGRRRT